MNVMAKAHEITREKVRKLTIVGKAGDYAYSELFRVALIQVHKECKAMQSVKPEIQTLVDQMNDRIAKLRALPSDGYIQVLGSARIVINAETGALSNIEACPVYGNKEEAAQYDGRVLNGKGETNRCVSKSDQIRFMVIQCKEAIQGLMAQ